MDSWLRIALFLSLTLASTGCRFLPSRLPDLGIAANFLLFHAPALIGIALLAGNRVATAGGWVLVVGLVLFAGDLVMLTERGASPFALAAPIGGSLLILGWLLVALSPFVGRPGGSGDH